MDSLTQTTQYPLDTFTRCQICGHSGDDICEFRFWWECDDEDKPEPYNILVTCKNKSGCHAVIDAHERLYVGIPWGRGLPGHLSLLCGNCSHRDHTRCTHPDLRTNGGEGLTLHIEGSLLSSAVFCVHDESKEGGLSCHRYKPPYIGCVGLPPDHPRNVKDE